jgi:hypothetical protein
VSKYNKFTQNNLKEFELLKKLVTNYSYLHESLF